MGDMGGMFSAFTIHIYARDGRAKAGKTMKRPNFRRSLCAYLKNIRTFATDNESADTPSRLAQPHQPLPRLRHPVANRLLDGTLCRQ